MSTWLPACRARVDLHNERAAPLGEYLDPTKLNFPADWDVSQPVVVAVLGAREGPRADGGALLVKALLLHGHSGVAGRYTARRRARATYTLFGAAPFASQKARWHAGQEYSRALAQLRPAAFVAL